MNDELSIKAVVEEVVRRLREHSSPEKIILFGSYAGGRPTKDSDLDILVVLDTALPPWERSATLRQAVGTVGVPIDIFVLTPDEFEETKEVIGGIAYAPAKYGQVVYEKP